MWMLEAKSASAPGCGAAMPGESPHPRLALVPGALSSPFPLSLQDHIPQGTRGSWPGWDTDLIRILTFSWKQLSFTKFLCVYSERRYYQRDPQ